MICAKPCARFVLIFRKTPTAAMQQTALILKSSLAHSPQGVGLSLCFFLDYEGSGLDLTEASIVREQINRLGGKAGYCHGQMYNMGTLLCQGSDG
jgi:hypothetical protein